ncbi:GGDEF domain-containing protein [Chitinibacter fontanus]|uniref:diguanylate cyclase n=1 Tax=Chitinibacter fontanus TaxID=1737446 RepID=A0A7D5VA30_9NEIS|nr:GGDEF domain-containing protein [Chitinibacter fontanus]QLI81758.1 GGDEF domain-containing protein [Chitinibacter fontanus]
MLIILGVLLLLTIIWQWQQIRQLRVQLLNSGLTDQLTGLYHRHHLMTLAEHEINRAQRSNIKVSALIIDLDYCAKINHQFGHYAGDLALQHLAKFANESIRDFDLAGRFSGEEIVLILPNTDEAGALVVAERLRAKVKQHPLVLSQHKETISVSVTIGIATLQTETETIEDLLLAADTALQCAMQQGIDRVHVFQPSS